jgi:hypothetical protein
LSGGAVQRWPRTGERQSGSIGHSFSRGTGGPQAHTEFVNLIKTRDKQVRQALWVSPWPAKGRSRPSIPESNSLALGRDPGSVLRAVAQKPAKGRSRPSIPESNSLAPGRDAGSVLRAVAQKPAKGRSRPSIPESNSLALGRDAGSVLRAVAQKPAKGRSRPSIPESNSLAPGRDAGSVLRAVAQKKRGGDPSFDRLFVLAAGPPPRSRPGSSIRRDRPPRKRPPAYRRSSGSALRISADALNPAEVRAQKVTGAARAEHPRVYSLPSLRLMV